MLLGGDARLLLIRESLFTGTFGLVCLISLLFPRPIMFYLGRHSMAGTDEHRRDIFNQRWYNPIVRRAHRLVTASVLALAPFLTGLATIGTILWTFWYAQRVRGRLGPAESGAA